MPVLTAPFTPIPLTILQPEQLFPPGNTLATELGLTPRATEAWDLEGLSLSFTLAYQLNYIVTKKTTVEFYEQKREALEKQLAAVQQQVTEVVGQYVTVESIFNEKKERAVFAELQGLNATKASLKASEEAIRAEIVDIERELSEIGRKEAREGARAAALSSVSLLLRLYARHNELLFNRILTPVRSTRLVTESGGDGDWGAKVAVSEAIEAHEQFDDPINITERENLRLALQVIGPPAITFGEGPELSAAELSIVQANVSYSRTVNGQPA